METIMHKLLLASLLTILLGACSTESDNTATVADVTPQTQARVGETPTALLPPGEASRSFTGYFTYYADAAIFRDCHSHQLLPVLMEQDYLALERAYSALRTEDIEPIWAEVVGQVVWHAAMEGPDRYHLLVEHFVRLDKDGSCPSNATPIPHNMP